MKEVIRPIIEFCYEIFELFPFLTGVLSLLLLIYSVMYLLPEAYKKEKVSLYSYYNTLGLIIVLIFFSFLIFVIQMFRLF